MEQFTNLYDRDTKKHAGGSVTVTSHRILWVFPTGRFSLYLECIQSVSEKSEFFKSAKAIIDLGGPGARCFVCISFPKGGRDAFVKALRQAIGQRGWEKAPGDNQSETQYLKNSRDLLLTFTQLLARQRRRTCSRWRSTSRR